MSRTTARPSTERWAFVNNPAKWGIDEFLRSGKVEDHWGVDGYATHQIEQFRKGQLAVVRVGRDQRTKTQLKGNPRLKPGIYGLCEVLSEVYPGSGGTDEFSYGQAVHPQGWPTVRVRYIHSYLENPLLIDDLRREAPELDKRLLQGPRRSSISLSEEDFTRLLSLLSTHPPDRSDIADVESIQRDTTITNTERAALIKARLGQGEFRTALLRRWTSECAVTGCTVSGILRASHIKPWRESTNAERLDAANGLLLVAHLDALFDNKLISFCDDGEMLVSKRVGTADRQLLGIPRRLRLFLNGKEKVFLALHRNIFQLLNV
jgi:hypothetical protein